MTKLIGVGKQGKYVFYDEYSGVFIGYYDEDIFWKVRHRLTEKHKIERECEKLLEKWIKEGDG